MRFTGYFTMKRRLDLMLHLNLYRDMCLPLKYCWSPKLGRVLVLAVQRSLKAETNIL